MLIFSLKIGRYGNTVSAFLLLPQQFELNIGSQLWGLLFMYMIICVFWRKMSFKSTINIFLYIRFHINTH